ADEDERIEHDHDDRDDHGPLGELLRGLRLLIGLEVAEQAEDAGDDAAAEEAHDGPDQGLLLDAFDVVARVGCGHGNPLLPDDRVPSAERPGPWSGPMRSRP